MKVIVIDGDCVLCNRFARFVLRHDRQEQFRFATQNSDFWLARAPAGAAVLQSTVVLIEDDGVYVRSEAVLRVLGWCGRGYALLAWLAGFIPVGWRDRVYNFVAARRHSLISWGGACPVPAPELRKRLLP